MNDENWPWALMFLLVICGTILLAAGQEVGEWLFCAAVLIFMLA